MNIHIQTHEITHDVQAQKIVKKWHNFLSSISDWQLLITNIQPNECGCGLVYEIPNPIPAENESFAIADMRNLAFAEPHYHPETEIYFILQGSGLVVVGGQEIADAKRLGRNYSLKYCTFYHSGKRFSDGSCEYASV